MNIYRLAYSLLVACLLSFPAATYAQSSKAAVEQSIKDHINSFAEAYEKLPDSKDKATVLNHFSKDLKSNIFYFSISGRSRITNSDLDGFDTYLTKVANSQEATIKYQIKEFPYIRFSGGQAVAVVKFSYEVKEKEGIWVKGEEMATYALRKRGSNWLIVHMTVMGMEDEKLKGSCLCELFVEEGKSTGVVAKTIVPSGRSYSTHYNDFDFRLVDGDWMIKTGNKLYKWKESGEVRRMDPGGKSVLVATSGSKKETVVKILSDDLYKENCANIKLKSKK